MLRLILSFLVLQCIARVYSGLPEAGTGFASIRTNCTKDQLEINLKMEKPFKGLIFAKGFFDECGIKGKPESKSLKLKLPVSACGVRAEMKGDMMEYSVRLVAQMDHKLQTKTDLETVAHCSLPSKMMDIKLDPSEAIKVDTKYRNGRMRVIPNTEHSTTKVRAWMELGGINGIGSVEVGQNTTLSVHLVLARKFGVQVVDCVCFDGIGEISQKLFDEFGCPVDSQIMPEFKEYMSNLEDGWSKPSDDDLVQKSFETNFPAFKFPDREILHLTCGIQLCNGECIKRTCDRQRDSSEDDLEAQIARIEVFNSLKVIAPQIELDRQDRSQNFTALPVRFTLTNSDVLCISSSKLTLVFCILGMIFLVAIIVAISCSLRSVRSHSRLQSSISGANSDQSGRRSIFSVVSSGSQQSSRIDSKLFSYGRVY